MKSKDIVIGNDGVNLFGTHLGLTPKSSDLQVALEDETIRRDDPSAENRQVRICDAWGLSWLVDLDNEIVFWLEIRLASFDYRDRARNDPTAQFTGRLCIDKYTVRGAFSLGTGEIIRKVSIRGLSLMLVPDGKTIRSVVVGFSENEKPSRQMSPNSQQSG